MRRHGGDGQLAHDSAQAYYIFDEFIVAGEVAETSKKGVFKAVAEQDLMEEARAHMHSSPAHPLQESDGSMRSMIDDLLGS